MSAIITIIALINLANISPVYGSEHYYRDTPCFFSVLSNSGEYLYIGFPKNNEIIKVDISTMDEISSFAIFHPFNIRISNDDQYIYVDSTDLSLWPNSEFIRLDLNTGSTANIVLNGVITNFILDNDDNYAWIIHRIFPIPGEICNESIAISDHMDSGYLSKVNLSNFILENSINTSLPLPIEVWYSEYSDKLYVSHEISENPHTFAVEGTIITIYNNIPSATGKFTVGGDHKLGEQPISGSKYSDDGKYYVVPNNNSSMPFALRIIDTNLTVPNDISILDPTDNRFNVNLKSIQKVEESVYIWALGYTGEPIRSLDRPKIAVRFNTSTLDYEIFNLPEISGYIRYFDVSQDGRTLYIPIAEENKGSILIISPGNHDPVCNLVVVTPLPHTGPSPVAIEFVANAFDDDGDALTYHWDFDGDTVFDEPVDDAYTGTAENPTHEYTADYEGPVCLKVTDNYQGECVICVIMSVDVE